jgi:hypothetical protein
MPPLGLKSCCINEVCCEALSLFHINQAEESVSEPPKPSICWYWVVASRVMTRPLELPPVAKDTLGRVCSSIALSPVVSTTCTLGPPDVVCVVSVDRGQLLRKRQAIPTHERRESRALCRSRRFVRVSGQIVGLRSDIFSSLVAITLGSTRCRQGSHACQITRWPLSSRNGLASSIPELSPAAGLGYPRASTGSADALRRQPKFDPTTGVSCLMEERELAAPMSQSHTG